MKLSATNSVGLAGLIVLSFACASNSNGGNGSGNSGTSQGGTGMAGSGNVGGTGAAGSGSGNPGSGVTGGSGVAGSGATGGSGAGGTGASTGGSGAGSGATATGSTTGSGAMSGAGGGTGSGGGSGVASSGTTPFVWDGGSPGFSQACQTMTAGLIAQMTRAQKAAQMVMAADGNLPISTADVMTIAPGAGFAGGGSNPGGGNTMTQWANMTDAFYAAAKQAPNAIPPLFGLDAVHGMNGATGTVIFPHNAGLASSRDPVLVEKVEQVAAQECLAGGVNWAFGPFAGTTWDYRWGRIYESFSEDPTWAGQMLTAAVKGFQGDGGLGTGTPGLVACSKHWAGDGQATAYTSHNGAVVDRGTAQIDIPTMQQWGIAPYLPALQAGLSCIMVSDAWWQIPGQPAPTSSMTYSNQLLTTLLKGMYGFKGFVISDWNAGGNVASAINAGVDMLMNPADWKGAVTTITNATAIPLTRIDDAVSRILNVKCQAGLWTYKRDPALLPQVGSAAHRMLGRQAVAQSLVLLQNTGAVLPLSPTAKVWVEGYGADNLGRQMGGWTISWQGGGGATTTGTTIKQAISKVVPLAASLQAADVDVVVITERAYAEFVGDARQGLNSFLTTDGNNPVATNDLALLAAAKAAGKKVVAIVVSGRPLFITNQLPNADAWIAAWLPGTEGDGVADVLFGMVKPTGKLSHSWPSADAAPNIADAPVNIMCKTCGGAGSYKPLFPLGFGLTYP